MNRLVAQLKHGMGEQQRHRGATGFAPVVIDVGQFTADLGHQKVVVQGEVKPLLIQKRRQKYRWLALNAKHAGGGETPQPPHRTPAEAQGLIFANFRIDGRQF